MFDAVTGAALLTGGTSVINSALNLYGQREQRSWEERMANSAHQREVADLRAAGLNPILSATHGGATTPNVAPPTFEMPDFSSAMKMSIDVPRLANETRLADAEIRQKDAGTALAMAQAESTKTNIPNVVKTLEEMGARIEQMKASSESLKASAAATRADMPWKEAVGEAASIVRDLIREVKREASKPEPDLIDTVKNWWKESYKYGDANRKMVGDWLQKAWNWFKPSEASSAKRVESNHKAAESWSRPMDKR